MREKRKKKAMTIDREPKAEKKHVPPSQVGTTKMIPFLP
jgi:hypothetical protein